MKTEELLKPRFKVIADYPGRSVEIGHIIDDPDYYERRGIQVNQYPHLFKKLSWWEDRKPVELSEYIQWYDPSDKRKLLPTLFKVENWYSNPNTSQIAGVYVDYWLVPIGRFD